MEINIQFSQASLQCYADCPRRFQLSYINKLSWPAVEAEPADDYERHMEMGTIFHKMIEQDILRINRDSLSIMAKDEDLTRWWKNYLSFSSGLKGNLYPEVILSTSTGGYSLAAKFDLLCINEEEFLIIDWKTSRKRPAPLWMEKRLQSRVYPYILTQGGLYLNGGRPISPDKIKMLYWFSNFPKNPMVFSYNSEQYKKDHAYLNSLIKEIISLNEESFFLTTETKHCIYCRYRSLCQRGIKGGNIEEIESETDSEEFTEMNFDFEQIAEIEF